MCSYCCVVDGVVSRLRRAACSEVINLSFFLVVSTCRETAMAQRPRRFLMLSLHTPPQNGRNPDRGLKRPNMNQPILSVIARLAVPVQDICSVSPNSQSLPQSGFGFLSMGPSTPK